LTTKDIIKQGDGTINGLLILGGGPADDLKEYAKKGKPLVTQPNGFEGLGSASAFKDESLGEYSMEFGIYKKKRMPFDRPEDFHRYFMTLRTTRRYMNEFSNRSLKIFKSLHVNDLREDLKYSLKKEYDTHSRTNIDVVTTKDYVYFIAGMYNEPYGVIESTYMYYVIVNEEEVLPVHDRVFNQRFLMDKKVLDLFYEKNKGEILTWDVEDLDDRKIRVNYSKGVREYRKLEDKHLNKQ